MSMTERQKCEAFKRQCQRKLEREFEQRVLDECRKRVDEMMLPAYEKTFVGLEQMIKGREGCMSRRTYIQILARLHPDKGGDAGLFDTFKNLEVALVAENECPTPSPSTSLPRTLAEWEQRKRKASEERKAKRRGHQ